jgi:hypothetical protein
MGSSLAVRVPGLGLELKKYGRWECVAVEKVASRQCSTEMRECVSEIG